MRKRVHEFASVEAAKKKADVKVEQLEQKVYLKLLIAADSS